MQQGKLDREEVMDDVECLLWRDLGLGIGALLARNPRRSHPGLLVHRWQM